MEYTKLGPKGSKRAYQRGKVTKEEYYAARRQKAATVAANRRKIKRRMYTRERARALMQAYGERLLMEDRDA